MSPNRPLAATAAMLPTLLFVGLVSTVTPDPTRAQPVDELLPDEVAGFALERVNRRGPGAAQAIYRRAGSGLEMRLVLAAGEPAGAIDSIFRSQMGAVDGKVGERTVAGRTFTSYVAGSDLVIFRHADGVLLAAGRDDLADGTDREEAAAAVVAFLESFGPGRVEGWKPPEDPGGAGDAEPGLERPPGAAEEAPEPAPRRTEKLCGDMECLLEAADRCRPAALRVSPGPSVAGEYRIEGQDDAGGCRASFRFTENPASDLAGKSLRFRLDGEGDEISEAGVRRILEGCLEGVESVVESHGCEGPLVGVGDDER